MAQKRTGEPEPQISPDAELTKQFGIGCVVLFVAFLALTAIIWWFWTH